MAATEGKTAEGRAARKARPLRFFIFSALTCLSLTTCGLETVTTFQPPSFIYSGQNQLILTHNTVNNGSSMKGYEIFYRAFDNAQAALTARTTIETAASSVSATPDSCVGLLRSTGFSPIFDTYGNDGPNNLEPLFTVLPSEVNTAVSYTIWLDSSLPPSTVGDSAQPVQNPAPNNQTVAYWYYTRSTLSTSVHVGITRSASTSSLPKSFESNYGLSDSDYAGSGAGSNSTIYFVFFAVAYGIDPSSATSFNPIYSLPVTLYTSFQYTLPSVVQ
jgi:hypothetical protein